MGIIDRVRKRPKEDQGPPPKTILAAAMPMHGPEAARANAARRSSTTDQWQTEAWYYYDAIGELRMPVNWIANAVSKADLYAAEIDPETGKVTGPTSNVQAQQAAAMAFGGPAKRAQLQHTLAVCWQIAGEAWIIIRPRGPKNGMPQPDEWLVLSGAKVQAKGRSGWEYTDPFTGAKVMLGEQDRLIRVWSPHPNDQAHADSGVRPALPVLREIEKASQNIAARLDSRIAINGLGVVAQELDYPTGDFPTVASAFMADFMAAQEAGLRDPGTAASQVPFTFTAPSEMIANKGVYDHFDISTQFDAAVVELRTDGRTRLAVSLDMPNETAEGSVGDANHWSAWKVSQDTFDISVEPLLDREGDAVTEFWYQSALKAMGVPNPERYVLAWNTDDIVEPLDQTEDMKWAWDNVLISDDAMRTQIGVTQDQAPDEEEYTRRILTKLAMADTTLLANPSITQAMDLDIDAAPTAGGTTSPAMEPANTPPTRALPSTQGETPVPEGLTAAAEQIVLQALERAGARMLTNQNRGQFAHVDKHELYLHIRPADVEPLLEGSFNHVARAATTFGIDPRGLRVALISYTKALLTGGYEYNRDDLRRYLS